MNWEMCLRYKRNIIWDNLAIQTLCKNKLDRNELLTHCVSDCELTLVLQRYVAQDLDQTE